MAGFSQRVKIILAIIHTAFYWPLWWMVLRYSYMGPIAKTVLKFVFYSNLFMMLDYWYQSYMAAKGLECGDKDLVTFLLCVILFLILIELPGILYNLS